MHESKDTKWLHGPARFAPPVLPKGSAGRDGLMPMSAVINLEVGKEIVFYLKDSTPFIEVLAKARPFNFRVYGGLGRTQHGCLGFLVFWIPSPSIPSIPIATYDLYVNFDNEALLGMWRELAFQTHWHMILLDKAGEQRGFFEFINTFQIHTVLNEKQQYNRWIPVIDFEKAKAEFMARYCIEDLFSAGASSLGIQENGLFVYDERFAIPHPSNNANPFGTARYVRILRESVTRHSKNPGGSAAEYLDAKLIALQSQLTRKKIVYLDVCHWINLRHVWLLSPRARPIYNEILDCLKRLLADEAVLCPLSVPIFEELMKQLDPRSRAATANLMDIFSQGITVMRFEDAFAQQCGGALSRKDREIRVNRGSVSKVGLWFGDEQARAACWSPDVSDIWRSLSIDLRWEMTVCESQKLTAQGIAPHREEREFLSRWMELPTQQKASQTPFGELSKRCRRDVVNEYVERVISGMESGLGEEQRTRVRGEIASVTSAMIDSGGFGRIPCCEILAGMCAARVFEGGGISPNDIYDFLHASAGIPASNAFFCDGPMEHLLRSKQLKLDDQFGVRIHSRPEDLLAYLHGI
jgi:hypothetical protein